MKRINLHTCLRAFVLLIACSQVETTNDRQTSFNHKWKFKL